VEVQPTTPVSPLSRASSIEQTRSGRALRRRVLDGSVRILLAEGLILPTGLITAFVLTHYLGPTKYGLFTLTSMTVTWIEFCITSFFARTTIKLIGEAEDWRPWGVNIVRMHLLTGGVAGLLLWGCSSKIAQLMSEPALTGYLRLLSLDIPLFSLATAHRNILVGMHKYRERAVATAGRLITRLLLMVVLVAWGFSVEGAIWATIGASLFDLMLARRHARAPLWGAFPVETRQIWHFALPLFLAGISLTIFERLDLFMLKALGATAALAGMYGAAQNLTIIPALLGVALAPVLLAALTHAIRAGEFSLARDLARDAIRFSICLLPFAALISGCASAIVALVVGRSFAPTASFLSLLIFAGFARLLLAVASAALIAANKPGSVLALTGTLVPIGSVAHFVAISRWGASGASWVTTVLSVLAAAASVGAVCVAWKIQPSHITLIRSALISALTYLAAVAWPATGLMLLVKLVAISGLILAAYISAGEFDKNEISSLCSLVRPKTPESEFLP
jgi:O-antigen/teichoic acid export membrane protein